MNPTQPRDPPWTKYLYALILIMGLLLAFGAMLKQAQPVKPVPELAVLDPLDRSELAQRKRSEIVKAAAQQGLLTQLLKLDAVPEVYIGPLFNKTPKEDREQFLGMIYAFFLVEDPKLDYLLLIDGASKQPIGRYTREGLTLSASAADPRQGQ